MRYLVPTAGAAIALAGVDKLAGNRGYKRLFHHLGWSTQTMRAVAAAETVGGILMMPGPTQRLGGAVVAAVSTIVLASELRQGDGKLAASRAGVLLAGLVALLGSSRPAR